MDIEAADLLHQRRILPHDVAQLERENLEVSENIWLPPRDSNPDMLIQSQLSCH